MPTTTPRTRGRQRSHVPQLRPRQGGADRAGAAGGKNLEVFSPTVSRELLELGLIDEIDLHVAPVLLGEGIRPCDNPGSERSACTGSAKATRRRVG